MEINLGETFLLNPIQHNQMTLVMALSGWFYEIGCYSRGILMVLRASVVHLYYAVMLLTTAKSLFDIY
ncbi:hypothetical protein HUN01_01425 (plasmid) [Nostoc edaphicum CCNP1411]|uniref:Uncharacterized protein n=1 Tax=Nostoc edaphicum CCNP1411 TaxID=1472755 RepID=A0A7D7LDI2_9NOSO|nr:hypothetical protein [Nostoc edaphicum]QMS86307.1 hypothetical protein HUN01_01425 [Nostoc edaphicum CCNP1411]